MTLQQRVVHRLCENTCKDFGNHQTTDEIEQILPLSINEHFLSRCQYRQENAVIFEVEILRCLNEQFEIGNVEDSLATLDRRTHLKEQPFSMK
jgi:hypothetical protein